MKENNIDKPSGIETKPNSTNFIFQTGNTFAIETTPEQATKKQEESNTAVQKLISNNKETKNKNDPSLGEKDYTELRQENMPSNRRKPKNKDQMRLKIEKTKMTMPQTNEYQDIHFEDPIQSDTEYRRDTIQSGLKNNKEVKIKSTKMTIPNTNNHQNTKFADNKQSHMVSHNKTIQDIFLKNKHELTSEGLQFEGNQFMQINKSMKSAPNNNKQQETSKPIGDINNQKKYTESSYKTVDIGQSFVAHIQQVVESDVEGSKINVRKDQSEDMQKNGR